MFDLPYLPEIQQVKCRWCTGGRSRFGGRRYRCTDCDGEGTVGVCSECEELEHDCTCSCETCGEERQDCSCDGTEAESELVQ